MTTPAPSTPTRRLFVSMIAEVCGELGVPYRVNGYRYWPATG